MVALKKKIGILALQGGIIEHIKILQSLDVEALKIYKPEHLRNIDGLILPGGESTAIGKLLMDSKLVDPIRKLVIDGMPIWGTCAGMILLAKKISNYDFNYLGVMDITVQRNAYGSQLNSFITSSIIPIVSEQTIKLVFIRAPIVVETGEEIDYSFKLNRDIVMVKQKNIIATSFHPELTDQLFFHKFFIDFCK